MSINPKFKYKKSLGQNFLRHPEIAQKITATGNLTKEDTVIEIGPGMGVLTKCLAPKVKEVIAIEIDTRLQKSLKETLKNYQNVKIVFGDALKFDPPKNSYKIVANIPYSITSPLLNHFIKDQFIKKNGNPTLLAVLMVQKEVAKKICATPPDMNVLALNVQTFGRTKYLFEVGKESFMPQPKVDSAVIEIEIYKNPLVPGHNLKYYFELISAAFFQKRKILRNSLKKIFGNETETILKKAGIDPKRRPETLTLNEWREISEA